MQGFEQHDLPDLRDIVVGNMAYNLNVMRNSLLNLDDGPGALFPVVEHIDTVTVAKQVEIPVHVPLPTLFFADSF